MGGFRQALQWMNADREAERARMFKIKGICNRICDSGTRLMSMGYNKLIEEWKARQGMLKDKLKFVIKTLTDKDAQMSLMAFNGLKQRALMLSGVGMGDAQMKKIALIKRLTNQGFNLQCMAVNQLFDFLESEREREEAARLEYERQQKEKDRILRRMIDSNVRLMGAGYNKLIEDYKARTAYLKEKLKFVIKTLTDADAQMTMMAYNGLKQRKHMIDGVGFGEDAAQKLKLRLIRKLTDQGFNLQSMAVVQLFEFLKSEREREEAERLEYERQQKEKDRILRRIMDSNVRFMGMGFRQANQWALAEAEREGALMAKQRGIMRRMVDSNTRLMGAGYNKLIEEWKARHEC